MTSNRNEKSGTTTDSTDKLYANKFTNSLKDPNELLAQEKDNMINPLSI